MRILFLGDVFGKPGRKMAELAVPIIKKKELVDIVVANAENAAGGNGITAEVVEELHSAQIDCLTSGNHHWDKKEMLGFAEEGKGRLLRPLNYPPGTPGSGSAVIHLESGEKCGVICVVGRLFMKPVDCPFRAAEDEVRRMSRQANAILVDFHAEATSEKEAFAHFMDGRVSAVVGTHTHVQTSDERILPRGTAYMTDVGMTGPADSVIGIRKDQAIARFLTQLPLRFEVAKGEARLEGVIISITPAGKAESIKRIRMTSSEVALASQGD